jgi:PAS domain S-box-containing protein
MSIPTRPPFPLRITLIFVVLYGLWVLLSDRAVLLFATEAEQLAQWQTWKGWAYIAVLAVLLYMLLRREAAWHLQTEATLHAAEEQYRQLFEANPLPCWVYDAERLTIHMANTAALRHYGYSLEEFQALKIQDLHPAEDVPLLLDYHSWIVQGRLTSKSGRDTVWQHLKKDGLPIKVELTWTHLIDRKAVLVVANDVTRREATMEALRESEQRFSTIFHEAPLAIAIARLRDSQLVDVNDEWQRLTGYTREQAVGHTPLDLQIWADASARARMVGILQERGRVRDFEIQLRHQTGALATLSMSADLIEIAGEECMLSMAVDITARQQAEAERAAALAALHDSEERFRRALENIPDVIALYDPELRIRYINQATRRLTGRAVEEFIGRRDDEIWPPEIYAPYLPTLRRALETRHPDTVVTELELPGSGNRNLQITCVPLLDETGAVREILSITHDFTEHQQAAEALRHYAERLKVLHEVGRASLAGQPPQHIAQITLDLLRQLLPYQRGTITWISSQTQDAVGVTQVNDRSLYVQRHATSRPDKPQLTINIPLQARGELIGTLNLQADQFAPFTAQDVDIAREAADELALALQHAQLFEQVRTGRDRMERLSRRLLDVQETERRAIARELHDEIGQALTVVKIELQGIQRQATGPAAEELTDSIDVVDQALQQVRDLSLDLRPSLLDDLGLPAALRWYVDRQAQRAGLEANFNVDTVRERLLPNIETVCFRVVQEAVTNIIRHAHAQRIYVELIRREDQLWLTIQDDGRGFEVSSARARAAAGASLGLLGMEERVWLSGGEIEIESTPGRGATVRARLPFRRRDDHHD